MRARLMMPAFQSRARCSMRAVSAGDSAIGGMPGGQGWGRGRAAARFRCRTAGQRLWRRARDGGWDVAGGGRCRGQDVSAGERGLDGGGPQLGEGGQRGVPAERVPGPGLGLIPAEGVLPRFERYFAPTGTSAAARCPLRKGGGSAVHLPESGRLNIQAQQRVDPVIGRQENRVARPHPGSRPHANREILPPGQHPRPDPRPGRIRRHPEHSPHNHPRPLLRPATTRTSTGNWGHLDPTGPGQQSAGRRRWRPGHRG